MSRACLLAACLLPLGMPSSGTAPAAAADGVHRCLDPRGQPVYSDQPCEHLGALPRVRPGAGMDADIGKVGPPECARSPERLLEGVRAALETRDVNRLASYYHWAGTSAGGARFLMDELEALVRRPMMALDWLPAPHRGDAPATEATTAAPVGPSGDRARHASSAASRGPSGDSSGGDGGPGPADGSTDSLHPPAGLRLQPGIGPTEAGAVAVEFRVRQHAGCWWIEF
ncbi:DUF4124 domain-containing protein [Arenimonas fontis]|uniref:DUF4124 domain-containing protein n=1 Tax=Arenimonas fontis TaxID=2608255 RepID=UPI001661C284|nr:DUF4124 domain-containing protein [Arenimonas fontis]